MEIWIIIWILDGTKFELKFCMPTLDSYDTDGKMTSCFTVSILSKKKNVEKLLMSLCEKTTKNSDLKKLRIEYIRIYPRHLEGPSCEHAQCFLNALSVKKCRDGSQLSCPAFW